MFHPNAMGTGTLTIDTAALAANWRALDAKSTAETAAVVKADGYGLGVALAANTFAKAGARNFFVAVAKEGVALRAALGPGRKSTCSPDIWKAILRICVMPTLSRC